MKLVDDQLGAVARPARVRFVTLLPKTRSGKLLRRAIQAVCEGRDPGDLTTIEDPAALQQIRDAEGARASNPSLGSNPDSVAQSPATRALPQPQSHPPTGSAVSRRFHNQLSLLQGDGK
jgi:hypothetical protein